MKYSGIKLFTLFILLSIIGSGCSLVGYASMKKAEAEQKKLQQREKVIDDMSEFEMADIYFNNWSMKKLQTTSGETIDMQYRGTIYADVYSSQKDSVYSLPLYYNRVVFYSDGEFVAEGNINSATMGENKIWKFELFHPDTTITPLQADSVQIEVVNELTFSALRNGMDTFKGLPFQTVADEYAHTVYSIGIDDIKSWGVMGATSDSTYRSVPLDHIEQLTYKSGPVPPVGMGSAIFMGFAIIADILIVTTAGLIWLL